VSISTAPGQLVPQANELRERTDVDPHRFSRAWWCARSATDGRGRIVGLATTTVGARPAVLAYVRSEAGLGVRVVTGCDTPGPTATPWVRIGE
jgi:hypothetical protein